MKTLILGHSTLCPDKAWQQFRGFRMEALKKYFPDDNLKPKNRKLTDSC